MISTGTASDAAAWQNKSRSSSPRAAIRARKDKRSKVMRPMTPAAHIRLPEQTSIREGRSCRPHGFRTDTAVRIQCPYTEEYTGLCPAFPTHRILFDAEKFQRFPDRLAARGWRA